MSRAGPLRVTLCIADLGSGGAQRVLLAIGAALVQAGHCVTLWTGSEVGDDFFPVNPQIDRVRAGLGAEPSCRWWDVACQARRLASVRASILGTRPDIVVSFIDTTNVLVLAALVRTGIPVIVSERIYPPLHAIGGLWSTLRRMLYPKAAAVVMQTHAGSRWARSIVAAERVVTIENAVLHAPVSAVRREPVVLAVGRLDPQKGFDLLIDAFSKMAPKHPNWRLRILGEGPEREALARRADSGMIAGRLEMPGALRDVGRHYASASAFVLSSRYEGFPNVLGEALAAGLPVVSFDCPTGPAEIVRDGVNGLLVRRIDAGDLAAALDRLLGDDALRAALAARAASSVAHLAPQRIHARWVELIESCAAAAAPAGRPGR